MDLSMFDLTGKVAIVTGGYRGIGRGIADGLAEAGASIVLCGRDIARCTEAALELKRLGVETLPVRCDVSINDDVQAMVSVSVQKFGKIDILVNNAGITGSSKSLVDMEDREWDETLGINLKGIFMCSRAVAKEMIKQGNGKIINVTSIGSFRPLPKSGDYCASKGGALMLTRVMALELVKYNIQVNAICPGLFDTLLNVKLQGKFEKEIEKMVPIGRIARISDIKGLAIFLASSASDYLVGSAIVIDGGMMLT
jgi:NAD(P)-dependent dehydrogenase (short-subunit alcohol dehydrogenase family)